MNEAHEPEESGSYPKHIKIEVPDNVWPSSGNPLIISLTLHVLDPSRGEKMPESITKSSESKDQIWGAVRNGKVIKKGSSPEEVHDKMNDAGYDRGDYGITILPDPKRSRML